MRTINTVLVLGAGASHGFGLPLGSGLRKLIERDLNLMFDREWGQRLESGSSEIVDALRLLVRHEDGRSGDINPHRQAAVQISGSMRLSSSIDEYIERHKDDPLKIECAKLAIAKAILEAERASTIFADPRGRRDPFEKASESWLGYMLRDLTRGLSKAQLKEAFENVGIINFNYDRCVEHYAYLWFQRVYDLNEEDSAEICNRIKIYHPYGSLGPLPYQDKRKGVPYGGEISAPRLIEIAGRIQTYSDAIQDLAEPSFVRSELASLRRLVFVGFGFHPPNIRILGSSDSPRPTLRCYATTEGIREPRLEMIRSQIASAMRVQDAAGLFFEHVRGTCEAFWDEYGEVIVQ